MAISSSVSCGPVGLMSKINVGPYSYNGRGSPLDKTKRKPPSLVSLCVGTIGKHLEDVLEDPAAVAIFPPHIKMAMTAIARRRKLLNDDVIVALADSSWDILDLSHSNVSDIGLLKLVGICNNLRAIDISHCSKITPYGVSQLVKHCHFLEILRWGGCPVTEDIARNSLNFLKPKVIEVEVDSWEELDIRDIVHGPQSLRWLVWPEIDKDSYESLARECPRIIVNPKPSLFLHNWIDIPKLALPRVVLDALVVEDIDPTTWAVPVSKLGLIPPVVSLIESPTVEEKVARLPPQRPRSGRRPTIEERNARLVPQLPKSGRKSPVVSSIKSPIAEEKVARFPPQQPKSGRQPPDVSSIELQSVEEKEARLVPQQPKSGRKSPVGSSIKSPMAEKKVARLPPQRPRSGRQPPVVSSIELQSVEEKNARLVPQQPKSGRKSPVVSSIKSPMAEKKVARLSPPRPRSGRQSPVVRSIELPTVEEKNARLVPQLPKGGKEAPVVSSIESPTAEEKVARLSPQRLESGRQTPVVSSTELPTAKE